VSVQEIRLFGDPVLTTPASLVTTFDKELRNLVKDLTETMLDAPGAGLAAPQIGVSLQVFVWNIEESEGHLINPTLDLSSDLQYETPRAFRAVAKGFNMHGDPVTIEGTELLARVLQHETDHLNGIVFIDRLLLEDRKLAMADIRNSEWFGDLASTQNAPVFKLSPHSTNGRAL